jgi:hypothetical protein
MTHPAPTHMGGGIPLAHMCLPIDWVSYLSSSPEVEYGFDPFCSDP